jgi:restriction endonuclease S subunit
MPNKLPKGWVKTTLYEVCLPVATIQPNTSPDIKFTYFDIGGIDNERNRIAETKTIYGRNAPSRARKAVRKGDILFSTVRTYLKNIARVEDDYLNPVASTGFTVIRPSEGVSSEFIFFQILSEDFIRPLNALQTGSSYPAVHDHDVFAQPILLPPIAEQERIVAKLNAALSAVQRAETAANRAKRRLDNYRDAVLNAAITGELTREWREQNSDINPAEKLQDGKAPSRSGLPPTWSWLLSATAFSFVTSGSRGWARYYSDKGALFIRMGNLNHNSIDLDLRSIQRVLPPPNVEGRRTKVVEGDILISITADVGMIALVKTGLGEAYINQHIALARPVDNIDIQYLAYFLSAKNGGQEQFLNLQRGATKVGLGLDDIRNIWIACPPLTEQHEVAREIERRLSAADRLEESLEQQLSRASATRQSLLHDALGGRLVPQEPKDEPALVFLERLRSERIRLEANPRSLGQRKTSARKAMKKSELTPITLSAAFERIGRKANADRLFKEVGCAPDEVTTFYETLRATPDVLKAFEKEAGIVSRRQKAVAPVNKKNPRQKGCFRLVEIWLDDFKNLKDYTVRFNSTQGLDVVLGWNGTGKSNLFEVLVIIFRDLHEWSERNRWPEQPMNGYRLSYEIDEKLIGIVWNPNEMKRPTITVANRLARNKGFGEPKVISRTSLPLPHFVFGYYSGPTNRLAEHFQPMNQAHYVRLREAISDDSRTLAALLEQRRFFCAETHHAKYVLLAFFYREDPEISNFLRDRLRIIGFDSALFIIRKPRWAKPGANASDFWGAKGVMRRVMERLRDFAIAPMVIEQTVSDGYRTTKEDHYYFFLPDLLRLHSFAAEYDDARTFFLALESTDFSELIHDVKIQVRVNATKTEEVPITFREMSEGEQQLLMVLGLMRFTKSFQSLVLLDEPDTHLNPQWSVDYLKLLTKIMSDGTTESDEQQTSQILISTHDPIVIASLVKEQIHLLKRDSETGACKWVPATVNPRGLGFTGILTSEMFGFRSDLDEETLADLDNKVRLMAKEGNLKPADKKKLEAIDRRLAETGFQKAFSDPYYAAFVRAWGRNYSELMAGQQNLSPAQMDEIERVADKILEEAKTEVEKKVAD